MHKLSSNPPRGKSVSESSKHFPNIHYNVHGDFQGKTSVFDLSDSDVPFSIHLVLWRTARSGYNATRASEAVHDPNPGPSLTLLIPNSYFDIPHALKEGLVTLYDRTDEVDVTFEKDAEEILLHGNEIANKCEEPWVMVPRHEVNSINRAELGDVPPEGFPPSSLITLPPHTGTSRAERRVTQDLADVLRPVVKPGHSYSIRFPERDILAVQWWRWGNRDQLLAHAREKQANDQDDQQDDTDGGNFPLTLNDLLPSATEPVKSIRTSKAGSPSFGFRVVDHWPHPPVLQVRLSLVPIIKEDIPIVSSDTGSPHSQTRYTISATITHPPTLPRPDDSTQSSTKSAPITLKVSSSQHIAVPFSMNHRRGIRQFTSPDILSPIYGFKPSLTNFHIIDIMTGEDLVQHITWQHPQGHHHRREQFLTLHPGDEVVKQGIRLPYPSEFLSNGNRKPKEGDPGYFAPHVRDMVPRRKYRITLRDKRFWWREGTVDGLFEGVDEDLLVRGALDTEVAGKGNVGVVDEEEKQRRAEEKRKKREHERAKIRRRVSGNLLRGLKLVCEDELVVECPPSED